MAKEQRKPTASRSKSKPKSWAKKTKPGEKAVCEKTFALDSELPPSPDFASLEANSEETAGDRTRILALIGNLVFTWSNNESMFIYYVQILLKTDFSSAAITFISLNTTRARLDLIRRLTRAKISDPAVIRKIDRLIERFNACTKVRNEFNHCIYQLDDKGQITHTTLLRISEKKNGVQFAQVREFDDARIQEMLRTIKKLTVLNRDLWNYLPEFERAVKSKT